MDNIEINIPDISFKKDFTIIYKGREEQEGKIIEPIQEIKTSKDELLRKLRYFKQRTSEINLINEIFIHDSFNSKLFKDFIDTLETHKIEVNDQNYNEMSALSKKYEYKELEEQLETFSRTRPDLLTIIENANIKELDPKKEEKLSKNLDICLQNQNFIRLPLPVLTRILNSPNRNLQDHHLLVEFIKKIINKYKTDKLNKNKNNKNKNNKNNNNIEDDDDERENLQILLGCLDYSEMSNEEIEEFLNKDELTTIFNFHHSKERMKWFIKENQKNENRFSQLKEQISSIEQKFHEIQRVSNEKEEELKTTIAEMKIKFEHQEKIILNYQNSNEELQKNQINQETKLKEFENRLKENEELKNKIGHQDEICAKLQQENQEIKNKIVHQDEICAKLQKENEKLQHLLSEQENKLKSIESIIHLGGKISAKVEVNQKIEGKIILKGITKLDKKRSKLIINTNNSPKLSENEYQKGIEINNLTQNFTFAKPEGTYFLHAFIVDNFGYTEELISEPLTTKGIKLKFDFTGRVQSVKLSPGTYKLEVWGSSGGENNIKYSGGSYSGYAGKGGYSVGTLKLNKETTLYVYVGGSSRSTKGGWNGGGSANSPAAGGGGSTDISLYGEEGSTEWNTTNHLYSRIIVAGGGGGSSHSYCSKWKGGCGGGLNGEDNDAGYAKGGIQTSGYKFGVGGSNNVDHNSGGGCGWYGGYASNKIGWGEGGGGGSGFVYNSSTASNYPSGCKLNSSFYLTDSKTISGNAKIPTASGNGTEQGHSGNGYAIITLQ